MKRPASSLSAILFLALISLACGPEDHGAIGTAQSPLGIVKWRIGNLPELYSGNGTYGPVVSYEVQTELFTYSPDVTYNAGTLGIEFYNPDPAPIHVDASLQMSAGVMDGRGNLDFTWSGSLTTTTNTGQDCYPYCVSFSSADVERVDFVSSGRTYSYFRLKNRLQVRAYHGSTSTQKLVVTPIVNHGYDTVYPGAELNVRPYTSAVTLASQSGTTFGNGDGGYFVVSNVSGSTGTATINPSSPAYVSGTWPRTVTIGQPFWVNFKNDTESSQTVSLRIQSTSPGLTIGSPSSVLVTVLGCPGGQCL